MTGTGIPNYWIHQYHKQVSGGEDYDVYQVDGDGTFRSLNYINRVNVGDIFEIAQSPHEFDDEDLWSLKTIYTVN